MYKTSIPVSLNTLTDEASLPRYLSDFKKCGAERVFICGFGNIFMKNGRNYTHPALIRRTVEYFRAAGMEVGFWVSSFGHGYALTEEDRVNAAEANYAQITDISGSANESYSNCPLDKNFLRDFSDGIRSLAEFSPDLIMLDDDFRFNTRRNNNFACFCPLHLAEYYKRLGEEIPREKLEALIGQGMEFEENKYRTVLFEVLRDSLLDFIKALRDTIDTVDPDIRLGVCDCRTWELHGTDPIEIAKTAAGRTKPFARTNTTPYHNINIIPALETTRQQFAWGKGSGVELFAEGDTYPRPRHNIPSKTLELFDFILRADGTADGMLAYIEDYDLDYDYERGYVDRYIRNSPIRAGIAELFDEKTPVGVQVFTVPHKAESWDLGDFTKDNTLMLIRSQDSPSRYLLSSSSIPTCFTDTNGYPLLIMGENARYVDLTKLGRGAILDASAAKILAERGVDTGLLDTSPTEVVSEYHKKQNGSMHRLDSTALLRITCKDGAEVLSVFSPSDTPASYRYENADGQRFYVLAFDLYRSRLTNTNLNFLKNYYRQADLADSIAWIAKKPLPAFCTKHPNLYILAAKGEGAMSVAIANVSLDDVFAPEILLDKEYTEIRFLNCTGRLNGDRVQLCDLPPYGFAAFEVK